MGQKKKYLGNRISCMNINVSITKIINVWKPLQVIKSVESIFFYVVLFATITEAKILFM